MWKPEHRRAAERNGLRYPSDLSNAEWAIAGPMIPPPAFGHGSQAGFAGAFDTGVIRALIGRTGRVASGHSTSNATTRQPRSRTLPGFANWIVIAARGAINVPGLVLDSGAIFRREVQIVAVFAHDRATD
jgi:hypothetical protein